jgi:hypothetical protein
VLEGSYLEALQLAQKAGTDAVLAVIADDAWRWSGAAMTAAAMRQVEAEEVQRDIETEWLDRRKGWTAWRLPTLQPIRRKVETENERWIRIRSGMV